MGRRGNEDYILPLRLQHGKTGLDYPEDGREVRCLRELTGKRGLNGLQGNLNSRTALNVGEMKPGMNPLFCWVIGLLCARVNSFESTP